MENARTQIRGDAYYGLDMDANPSFNNWHCSEHMRELFIKQSRIFATTSEDALIKIRDKYGDGKLSIRECNVQPDKNLTWYEFYIEINK